MCPYSDPKILFYFCSLHHSHGGLFHIFYIFSATISTSQFTSFNWWCCFLFGKTVANKRTSEFCYLIYSDTCIHNHITWAFIKIRKMNTCSNVSSVCTFVLGFQVLLILSLVLEPEQFLKRMIICVRVHVFSLRKCLIYSRFKSLTCKMS